MNAHRENNIPFSNNGFTIKLYGVKSETVIIIIHGNIKISPIITYFRGILFFIVNHHCIKLQDMTRHFYTHFVIPPFLFSFDAKYVPYISTPTAHHAENSVLYNINGFTIKLYGVKSDINGIIIAGNNKMVKIIRYLCGILFFIVNHHCIKLHWMIRNF